jgi:hypothetical protein
MTVIFWPTLKGDAAGVVYTPTFMVDEISIAVADDIITVTVED